MFKEESYIKRKIRGFFWRVFNAIENNGNCNFVQNGEKVFIDNLFKMFSEKQTNRNFLVFDIGANVGEYSEMIKRKADQLQISTKLHLFEPTLSCYSVISDKFANDENIILNNFGVSNEEGTATIFYDEEKSGLASLYQRNLASHNLQMNQSENIKLRRIDGYIEEKKIKHIDFVKIDIEGHELKAFEGFGKYLNGDFIDYIQFEYGGANLDSHTSLMEIYKFLEEKRFKIAKIMPSGLEIRRYSPFMDNFNYSNYVAVSMRLSE